MLVQGLECPDVTIRRAVAVTVGELRLEDDRLISALEISRHQPEMRDAAAEALKQIQAARRERLAKEEKAREEALLAEKVRPWAAVLRNTRLKPREVTGGAAMGMLRSMLPGADIHPYAEVRVLDLTAPMVPETTTRERAQAARELGRIGGPDAIAALRDGLNDPDAEVRSAARDALRALGQ